MKLDPATHIVIYSVFFLKPGVTCDHASHVVAQRECTSDYATLAWPGREKYQMLYPLPSSLERPLDTSTLDSQYCSCWNLEPTAMRDGPSSGRNRIFFGPTRQELCLSIKRKRVNSPRLKGEKGSGTPVVWPGQKLKGQAPLSCGLDKSSRCNTQAQLQDNKMAHTGITERARLNCSKHSFVLSATCCAVE